MINLLEEKQTDEPFTDEYHDAEIAFYGLKPYKNKADTVRIIVQNPVGILSTYFGEDFMTGQSIPALVIRRPDQVLSPAAFIEGQHLAVPAEFPNQQDKFNWQLWMSLTPMEIESSYLALSRSEGAVGTAGLGMGYFALRAASKESVESVTVFEQNPDVIKYFKYRFKDRPYFKKIKIVEGDARETCRDYAFDFFFADIYPTLLSDEAVQDMAVFGGSNNDISLYQFWGEERILFHMIDYEMLPMNWLRWDEKIFLGRFASKERLGTYRRLPYEQNVEFCKLYTTLSKRFTDR